MVDMGQALSAQDRRDAVRARSWPDAEERALRNAAVESGSDLDWQKYHLVRAARLEGEKYA